MSPKSVEMPALGDCEGIIRMTACGKPVERAALVDQEKIPPVEI